jgi:hypothetical protein
MHTTVVVRFFSHRRGRRPRGAEPQPRHSSRSRPGPRRYRDRLRGVAVRGGERGRNQRTRFRGNAVAQRGCPTALISCRAVPSTAAVMPAEKSRICGAHVSADTICAVQQLTREESRQSRGRGWVARTREGDGVGGRWCHDLGGHHRDIAAALPACKTTGLRKAAHVGKLIATYRR